MKSLDEQLQKMRNLILSEHGKIKPVLTEQNIKDKVLLDGACKKWNTMSNEERNEFTNNSTDILDQAKPIDMEVVCMAAEDGNFEEALPNQKYREVVGMLVSNTL